MTTEFLIPLINKNKEIVGHTKVDEDMYDNIKKGSWYLTNRGYCQGGFVGNCKLYLHRYVMGANKGDGIIDHKSCDKLDNRKSNLRFVTSSQNAQNKLKKDNKSSKYIGVSKIGEKWLMNIGCNYKSENFSFDIEEHAAYYYDILAVQKFGPDAKINGIEKPINFEIPIKKIKIITNVKYTKNGTFQARVSNNCKVNYLGTFPTKKEALDVVIKFKENLKKVKLPYVDFRIILII